MIAVRTTDDILKSMLAENTGASFLDSGGAYGRHWERNQGRDFESEPYAAFSVNDHGTDYTINVYHFLKERLEFLPELDAEYQAYASSLDKHDSWAAVTEAFAEDKGWKHVIGVNTYNSEDALSQTIQWDAFEDRSTQTVVIVLQIHNGCDVRGGYTTPHLFESMWENLCDNASGYIRCAGDPNYNPDQVAIPGTDAPQAVHSWDTDNAGYTWTASEALENLSDYETSSSPEDKGNGKIYYDEKGKSYCPECGAELFVMAPYPGY